MAQLMAHRMRHDLLQRLLQVFAQSAPHADQGVLQGRLQDMGDALFQQMVDLALHLMQDALRQPLFDGVPVGLCHRRRQRRRCLDSRLGWDGGRHLSHLRPQQHLRQQGNALVEWLLVHCLSAELPATKCVSCMSCWR